MKNFTIRQARSDEVDVICTFDRPAREDDRRRAFIERSVRAGNCFIAERQNQIVGYGVMDYSFYEQGFVSMLYVGPEFRRQGAGSVLMQHFESICQTEKLFTSTNLSNLPMQSLLAKLRYTLSGVIHDLAKDDPELVYVKYLRRGMA